MIKVVGMKNKDRCPVKGDIYCYNKKVVKGKLQESYIFIRYDDNAVMMIRIDPRALYNIDGECRLSIEAFNSDYTFTGHNAGDFVFEYEVLLKCCQSNHMYHIQQEVTLDE